MSNIKDKHQGKAAESKMAPIGNMLFYNRDPFFPAGVGGGPRWGAEDFVCLSEFGKDGPTAIETVPKGAERKWAGSGTGEEEKELEFDLNDFVLSIMSVDHQHQQQVEPGVLNEDSQSMVPLPHPAVGQAYVHHISLHDIAARGYARQVALSYISFDRRKVMDNMEKLLKEFMNISHLIKAENQLLFLSDIQALREELTKSLNELSSHPSSPGEGGGENQGGAGEEGKEEGREDGKIDGGEEEARKEEREDGLWVETGGRRKGGPEGEKSFCLLGGEGEEEEKKSEPAKPRADSKEQVEYALLELHLLEKRVIDTLHPDAKVLLKRRLLEEKSDEPKEKNSAIFDSLLHHTAFQSTPDFQNRELRPIADLCGKSYRIAIKKLHTLQQHFVRPPIILDFEIEDVEKVFPPSSLLSVGFSPLFNFDLMSSQAARKRKNSNIFDYYKTIKVNQKYNEMKERIKEENERGILSSSSSLASSTSNPSLTVPQGLGAMSDPLSSSTFSSSSPTPPSSPSPPLSDFPASLSASASASASPSTPSSSNPSFSSASVSFPSSSPPSPSTTLPSFFFSDPTSSTHPTPLPSHPPSHPLTSRPSLPPPSLTSRNSLSSFSLDPTTSLTPIVSTLTPMPFSSLSPSPTLSPKHKQPSTPQPSPSHSLRPSFHTPQPPTSSSSNLSLPPSPQHSHPLSRSSFSSPFPSPSASLSSSASPSPSPSPSPSSSPSSFCDSLIFEKESEWENQNNRTTQKSELAIAKERGEWMVCVNQMYPLAIWNLNYSGEERERERPAVLDSFASGILNPTCKAGIGKGLYSLRQNYGLDSFLKHVVFSLLKGRLVIIGGRDRHESQIKQIIKALRVFVPGFHQRPVSKNWQQSHPSPVAPWVKGGLKLGDATGLKLVGVALSRRKKHPIPTVILRSATFWDFQNGKVQAPEYEGELVRIALGQKATKMGFPDEPSLLAHVHHFLLDLGLKSFLYYHLRCVGIAADRPHEQRESLAITSPVAKRNGSDTGFERGKKNERNDYAETWSDKRQAEKDSASKSHQSPNHGFVTQATPTPTTDKEPIQFNPISLAKAHEKQIKGREEFCHKEGLHTHDMEIVEYLCSVVKEQQEIEMLQICGTKQQQVVVPPVRLENVPLTDFKNDTRQSKQGGLS